LQENRCTQDVLNLGRGLEILRDSLIEWAKSPVSVGIAASACDQMKRWVGNARSSCEVKLPGTSSLVEKLCSSVRDERLGVALEVENRLKQTLFDEIKQVRCGHPLAEIRRV